jgi:hypothetical protein
MKKPGALQELTQHTTEELNRLSPEEREQLRSNVLKQFGLPPLAAVRGLAGEAVIFMVIGGLLAAMAARSLMAGLVYGCVGGLGIWIVYRLLRFAFT